MSARALFALLALLTVTAGTPRAMAIPPIGRELPVFEIRDILDQAHRSTELMGRWTMIVALTGTGGGDAVHDWWQVADRRLPPGVRRITLLALDLAFFVPTSAVRSSARDHATPRYWHDTWLNRNGEIAEQLGLPSNDVPYVIVLDDRGRVVLNVHGLVTEPSAQAVWTTLAGH